MQVSARIHNRHKNTNIFNINNPPLLGMISHKVGMLRGQDTLGMQSRLSTHLDVIPFWGVTPLFPNYEDCTTTAVSWQIYLVHDYHVTKQL